MALFIDSVKLIASFFTNMINRIMQNAIPRYSPDRLPFSAIRLNNWCLTYVNGQDAKNYLQGQLTADMNTLQNNQWTFAGQCDAQGKLLSQLLLFPTNDGFAYLQRKSVATQAINALKKYAVFSKVTIAKADQSIILGFAGKESRHHLSHYFAVLPNIQMPVIFDKEAMILFIHSPIERFIVITTPQFADKLINNDHNNVMIIDEKQWDILDIAAGYAILDESSYDKFLPQAVNLQLINGISFKKGCYLGQEMIARAKYRGTNKRALYWLAGNAAILPVVSSGLLLKLNDNWRETGTILAAIQLDKSTIYVQAVLNNDLNNDTYFRLKEDENSRLTIQPLPYPQEET